MTPRSAEPETLWHYTDANGLFGIASSNQLRFGDGRFLNDCTERVYGTELLEQVFEEEIAKDNRDGLTSSLYKHWDLQPPKRLYVCSLSETKESISQWQRYGAGGSGYCIGFAPRGLDLLFDEDRVSRVGMIYDEKEQREILRTAVRRGLDRYTRSRAANPKAPLLYEAFFTGGEVDEATLCLKNPFFHDEKEWRYYLRLSEFLADDDESQEDFVVRGDYIKPYIQLPRLREHKAMEKLAIKAVVCGPRLDREVAVPAVKRFLRSRGYRDVIVEPSELASIWRQ